MKKIKILSLLVAIMFAFPCFAQFTSHGTHGKRSSKTYHTNSYLKQGYKGMIDFGYGISAGDGDNDGRIEFSTTHGYQFNRYIFAGVGIGVNYFHDADIWNLPIFANVRGTYPITNTKIAPFLDMRIGYSAIDVHGFYFAPSVGARLAVGENSGLSFGFGYEVQNYKADLGYFGSEVFNFGAVTFRLGFDF